MQTVGIFVDVQNVYYTTRQAYQKRFDYNYFWQAALSERSLYQANAYAIDRGDPQQRSFQNILRAIGFNVKTKPYIQRADGSAKGDWDVGITIDVMESLQHIDVLVLVSGDGDFELLVEKAKSYGKKVEVYGVPSLTADSLIHAATTFIPIEQDLLLNK